MNFTNQEKLLLRSADNRSYEPKLADEDDSRRIISMEVQKLLGPYDGISATQWPRAGVLVFPDSRPGEKDEDDESQKSPFFRICSDKEGTKTWINTGNCMGVVRLRDGETGGSVQIEITSRFDRTEKQFFLTYLLSKVFDVCFVDLIDLGHDSLWDLLLAFVFRRRLLEASAVGLFKQYQTFHRNDARIRGRIDVNEHLCRNIPFCGKVAYSTHEITFNNPTNHLIRHALAKASRKWAGLLSGDGLMDVRHELEQNTPTWQPGDVLNCLRRKENRTPIKHPFFHAAYEPLRQVSLAILRDEGASLYQQHQEAEGVIFDGSWLWEEYIWTLLKPLKFEHPKNREKSGAWTPLPEVTFYPDFFHREKRFVLDAKYKMNAVSSEDAKQVFAYMFLLDAVRAGLVKPDGEKCGSRPIKLECPNGKEAWWHDCVLNPPKYQESTTAEDFQNEMGKKEEEFREHVRQSLSLKRIHADNIEAEL